VTHSGEVGFEDPACGEKRSLQHWSEKKRKKEKHILTYMPVNEATAAAGLARLKGQCTVEGWGFEDPAHGVKSLCNIGQKRDEKKEKKKT